jgi:lipoprotein-anchoring transpeptidase ErfK/SrfK
LRAAAILAAVKVAAIGVVLALALGASLARADTTPTTTTETTTTTSDVPLAVPTGVVLGDVAVGGLSAADAEQAVLARFSRPVRLRIGRVRLAVSPESLGVSLAADTAVEKALTVAPDSVLGLHATVDRARVTAFVAKLGARFDRKPVAARLLLRGFRPVVTRSATGRTILQRRTVDLIASELAHGSRAPITVPAKIRQPSATSTSIGPVIVIRRASNLLTLYTGMRYVRQFHVATGQAAYPTPVGEFQIRVMWKNPWWYPPPDPWAAGEKPTPPGPGNPLGTRWMGLSAPGVGIHGTPNSASIGYSLSHGCIRMLIPQAEWLFDHVRIGTPVYIVSA